MQETLKHAVLVIYCSEYEENVFKQLMVIIYFIVKACYRKCFILKST